ncbi:MAG: DUF4339 domain-containing protein [Verrucomicrobiota bacterium]|nr:DUF4339 domain-containing protein [Verrucomicrobiota bacterium]
MNSPEVFYLHIEGEQRGPYTVTQIDHLVNSGLVAEETLYWREGLEQWQPVTELVHKRVPEKRWVKTSIIAGVALLVLLLVQLFGPITLAGWREANQHEFTPEAAYWRAREIVRHQILPKGAVVEFCEPDRAEVQLQSGTAAVVQLYGEVPDARGRTRESAWEVKLQFDPRARQWSGAGARETAPR